MPEDVFDPWALTSGLIDDIDVTVRESYFAFDPNYNDGETLLLKWECDTDDDDEPTTTLMFPTGKGWDMKNKGAQAVREDGKEKAFGKSSGIGLLITAAIEVGAGDVLKDRGTPMEAGIWEGLSFHMKRRTIDYKGDIGEKERLLPTEFKGAKGQGASGATSTPATTPATTPAAAPTAAPTNAGSEEAMTGKVRVALMKLARAASSHDEFMEKAYDMPEVDTNPAVQAVVDNPDGFYAEVKAEG